MRKDVDGEREDDRRVLLRRDGVEGLKERGIVRIHKSVTEAKSAQGECSARGLLFVDTHLEVSSCRPLLSRLQHLRETEPNVVYELNGHPVLVSINTSVGWCR